MTKQMSNKEIAALNKEFKDANAFTQWKFMQTPEYQRLPLAVRCTVEKKCLTFYFDMITNGMTDWKLPIEAVIPIILLLHDIQFCACEVLYCFSHRIQ